MPTSSPSDEEQIEHAKPTRGSSPRALPGGTARRWIGSKARGRVCLLTGSPSTLKERTEAVDRLRSDSARLGLLRSLLRRCISAGAMTAVPAGLLASGFLHRVPQWRAPGRDLEAPRSAVALGTVSKSFDRQCVLLFLAALGEEAHRDDGELSDIRGAPTRPVRRPKCHGCCFIGIRPAVRAAPSRRVRTKQDSGR